MRQIVLDTETTGLEPSNGHRIIEIGCVELVNREATGRVYHQYINPERAIDQGALQVHGIGNEFLADKPVFAKIIDEFVAFIKDAELIIHNAPFDVGFIDHELKLVDASYGKTCDYCTVFDTLTLARKLHPGRKNNLDALCKRYEIDNSERNLHGALLDAKILSHVYLTMTGGQVALFSETSHATDKKQTSTSQQASMVAAKNQTNNTPVLEASTEELNKHKEFLEMLSKKSDKTLDW